MIVAAEAMVSISGETYFFRDRGQFDLLRLRLLPELIERQRGTKTLRLWSAGCASGEEAYSLAILVDMLLPARDGWEVVIVGSDIDPSALAKARRGHYGEWSFRMVPATLRQRYFQRLGGEWALNDSIRRMVTFTTVDLLGDPFPQGELQAMDLILCRNVLIYFGADAVAAIANKLAVTLQAGGYLMTGHTELMGIRLPALQSRLFADGVVYQRRVPEPAAVTTPARAASSPARAAPAPDKPRPMTPQPAASAPTPEQLLAQAHAFADRGEYAAAEQRCRSALAAAPLAAEGHFLLAQLAQLKGNFTQAAQLLDKTLYLDPGHLPAYLELAALCERTENLPRVRSLRRAALEIVRALPGDTVIEPYETTAAEMAQWLSEESATAGDEPIGRRGERDGE